MMFMSSFLGGGGPSIQFILNGETDFFGGPPMISQSSHVGTDFDEYTQRVLAESFPYSPVSPASRLVENLWSGRRFRLYQDKNSFRQGRVVSWKQWNCGPFSRTLFWNLNVKMDSIDVGDTIVVDGTRLHNGKEATILEFYAKANRYKIQFLDNGGITTVKSENIKPSSTTYCVNRMNIDGGGTLTRKNDSSDTLLSLEWMDPAVPSIDLDEGALKLNCPTCRAVEPPHAAYDDSPPLSSSSSTEKDCPVCMERQASCRTLACGHDVCNECWNKW